MPPGTPLVHGHCAMLVSGLVLERMKYKISAEAALLEAIPGSLSVSMTESRIESLSFFF